MSIAFYLAGAVAIAATALVITRTEAVHALLYLVVSLLAVAVVFFVLGAPFMAALEVIVYAGAIMVLFVFVVMMLNLGEQAREREFAWLTIAAWRGPALLSAVLFLVLVYVVAQSGGPASAGGVIGPKEVSIALFGPYLLVVELASMLLMAGLVGAYSLGRRDPLKTEEETTRS